MNGSTMFNYSMLEHGEFDKFVDKLKCVRFIESSSHYWPDLKLMASRTSTEDHLHWIFYLPWNTTFVSFRREGNIQSVHYILRSEWQWCFLSHDECVFMQKWGYGEMSNFPTIVTGAFFGGDTRAAPRRPEVACDVTRIMLADWLIPGYHWWRNTPSYI